MMKISYKKFGMFAATAVLAGILADADPVSMRMQMTWPAPRRCSRKRQLAAHRILWMQRMRISC